MTATGGTDFEQAYAGPVSLPSLCNQNQSLATAQSIWRRALIDQLFGPIPDAPTDFECRREHLTGDLAERLILTMSLPGGRFTVDAALWLPKGTGPWPVIIGLDFIGPIGIMSNSDFPLDSSAIVSPRAEFGAFDGSLTDVLRGVSAPSWPVSLLTEAGFAVIVSCYGSWCPDHPTSWTKGGLKPLINCPSGAISLWAWAFSRLIDAAKQIPEINCNQVAIAGHSRLGKAALWAAANDERITATFANNSGAAGAALSCHQIGETLRQLQDRFPHWLRKDAGPIEGSLDQHMLVALAAPRAVYIAAARDDLWADPIGSYLSLSAAAAAWPNAKDHRWPEPREVWGSNAPVANGRLGYHLRPGGHGLLPYDWRLFLSFLDQAN